MGDGHLGKCKDCTKKDSEDRRLEKMKDPEWVVAEAERQRIKQRKARENGTAVILRGAAKTAVNSRWRAANPQKKMAHNAVNNAVRDGKMMQKPCEVCGVKYSEAHHDDYSKPLDVIWLCPKHHAERHVMLRDKIRREKALAKAS